MPLLSDRIHRLKLFLETGNIPDHPVEVPFYGVIVNPKEFFKDKVDMIEKDPDNPYHKCLVALLEKIKGYFIDHHFC